MALYMSHLQTSRRTFSSSVKRPVPWKRLRGGGKINKIPSPEWRVDDRGRGKWGVGFSGILGTYFEVSDWQESIGSCDWQSAKILIGEGLDAKEFWRGPCYACLLFSVSAQ